MTKVAFITGITGQDGSYLAEHLLSIGYVVHGLVRRASMFNRSRIEHIRNGRSHEEERLHLHYGELNDPTSVRRLLQKIRPSEVYHLAGQSHVGLSFEMPEVTCLENAMATLALLEVIRDLNYSVRFYHASSSEIFGNPNSPKQSESTPYKPVNPYGCAKAFATNICSVYREAYGLFVCSGISYNHESPRRGENFVTRKISMSAVRLLRGHQSVLELGNLQARRDWGYAPEYVVAMWQILQSEVPRDYVLATGRTCSVREFAAAVFDELGVELEFGGEGDSEFARRKDTGSIVIKVDKRYYRPVESSLLVGDPTAANKAFGWMPKVWGRDLARLMARADWNREEASITH